MAAEGNIPAGVVRYAAGMPLTDHRIRQMVAHPQREKIVRDGSS